jgi:predicted NAD-dependent protein-ADP-ribosyltransferase YbiA (DUF1768 family)
LNYYTKLKIGEGYYQTSYVSNFVYNGKTYRSAEHAFHAQKFLTMNTDEGNEAGFKFALESNSELSKGDGFIMAQKNRKLILMNKEHIHFWSINSINIMKDILQEKFTTCEECKNVLK